MRETVDVLRVQADNGHKVLHSIHLPTLVKVVDFHGLADDRLHRHLRVQGRIRVLKDELHMTTRFTQLARIGTHDLKTLKENRPRRGRNKTQDRAASRRLTATTLADQAERLALANLKTDIGNGLDRAGLATKHTGSNGEVLHQVLHRQYCVGHSATSLVMSSAAKWQAEA